MKTSEEIKDALLKHASAGNYCLACSYHNDPYEPGIRCADNMCYDAYEYIEILEDYNREIFERMPKWISVKERRPENAQRCIVITGFQHPDVCVATYYEISSRGNPNGDWIFDDGDGWQDTVAAVYWMPLPDLLREG